LAGFLELASRFGPELDIFEMPDQLERIERAKGALDYAAKSSLVVEPAEASQWLLKQYNEPPMERPRVFFHSIIWQYFSRQQQHDFRANIHKLGDAASEYSPVIWMRLEPAAGQQHAELTVTIWPSFSR
jgi:hypothetical protein